MFKKLLIVSCFYSVYYNESYFTPRDKCVYYNRTNNKLFTSAYEGIPENLLLNILGWLVS